jgi:hypothetical protein
VWDAPPATCLLAAAASSTAEPNLAAPCLPYCTSANLTGGPNGSLGVGCATNTCGAQGTALPVAADATCLNGDPAVSGFSDGLSYCCPAADECLAHGQSDNNDPDPAKRGLTVPVCLKGSRATVELCRRENDNLLPTIQVCIT